MGINKTVIEKTVICNHKYKVNGFWKYEEDTLFLIFTYKDHTFKLLFEGLFNESSYIWLIDIAEMMISKEIEAFDFKEIESDGELLWQN